VNRILIDSHLRYDTEIHQRATVPETIFNGTLLVGKIINSVDFVLNYYHRPILNQIHAGPPMPRHTDIKTGHM